MRLDVILLKGKGKIKAVERSGFKFLSKAFPHLSLSWKMLEQIVHKMGHRLDAVVFIPGTDLQVRGQVAGSWTN